MNRYRIVGFRTTDVTEKTETYALANDWDEAETLREEAENLGWHLVRIIEICDC